MNEINNEKMQIHKLSENAPFLFPSLFLSFSPPKYVSKHFFIYWQKENLA